MARPPSRSDFPGHLVSRALEGFPIRFLACRHSTICRFYFNWFHYKRTNIIAGLCNNKCVAPFVFDGNCSTNVFNTWVEKVLLPELTPGQFVVMDNATFHKSRKTRELLESAGCGLIFLPPYSPDLNPIEKFWANLKRWIRAGLHKFKNLFDAIVGFFQSC